jgi:diguanylate cyclase
MSGLRERVVDADTRLGYAIRLAAVSASYFGAAKAGLALAFTSESVTAVWPPTGLALAAVLIWGYRMWPAVAVGAFLANITTAGSVATVLGITTGNTLEALAGAYLLVNVAGFRRSLERVRDVLSLVLYAAVISTMISATIGVSSLAASGLVSSDQIASTWRLWWLGDLGGDVVVAPALLILASRPRLERRPWIRLEAAVLLVLMVAVSVLSFTTDQPIVYTIFPILFWIAFRYRQPGIAVASLITSGIAVWFTARGHGPFIGGSMDAELLRAQTFVGIATVSGLLIAALSAERRDAEERLRHRAEHDSLTGLVNSSRFTHELERWVSYNLRYGGQGAVMVLDLDNFKDVNDELGHAAGDQVIARVGQLLRRRLRETDLAGRWGGDEFTVLLPRSTASQADLVAADLLERVRQETSAATGNRLAVTVSIGVTPFGEGVDLEAEQVLASADAAMYQAKLAGTNRIVHSELEWRRAEIGLHEGEVDRELRGRARS